MRIPSFRPWRLLLVAAVALGSAPLATAQQAFPTPEAAASALIDAVARHDETALQAVLGRDFRTYLPKWQLDPDDTTRFLAAWARGHRVVPAGDRRAVIETGQFGWTLPIPIVQSAAGWRFDPVAGADEIKTRRIGRNELAAIQAVQAYGDAQREFRDADADGNGVPDYAQRIVSTPGKRDGLYWAALPGEDESPLGPQFGDYKRGEPYHGYRFRILTAQGKDAPGGAKSFLRNGRMTEGHALVAWPAQWFQTGVMSFIVGPDGAVYQRNLGPQTDAVARAMTAFDPGPGWVRVAGPE